MAETMQPLVSIIMPAHNASRFIEAAIQSVRQQTYPQWELLVIDDASTDNTAALVQGVSDDRIRYHWVERIGSPAGVRNQGLQLARGEFIAFLDADDLYLPGALQKLASCLIENPSLTAAYGFARYMDEAENPIRQDIVLSPNPDPQSPHAYQLPPQHQVSWSKILGGDLSCQLPALMVRRSTVERVGVFNEALCGPEDYEYYARLYLDNFEGVHCVPDYIYRYRVYGESLTKSPEHLQRILQSALQIKDWLFTEAPLPKSLQRYKSRSYLMCYRYFARERLMHQQPVLARSLMLSAFRHPAIRLWDWLQYGPLLLLRSYLPGKLNTRLIQWRSQVQAPNLMEQY